MKNIEKTSLQKALQYAKVPVIISLFLSPLDIF